MLFKSGENVKNNEKISFRLVGEVCPSPQQFSWNSQLFHDFVSYGELVHPTSRKSVSTYWIFFFLWRCGPTRAMASSFLRFLDHTQRRITVGRTHLDKWSARRREVYLTTQKTHNRNPCHRRDANPHLSRRAAADLRLRPRDQWDRQRSYYLPLIIFVLLFPASKCFPRCFSIKETDSLSKVSVY